MADRRERDALEEVPEAERRRGWRRREPRRRQLLQQQAGQAEAVHPRLLASWGVEDPINGRQVGSKIPIMSIRYDNGVLWSSGERHGPLATRGVLGFGFRVWGRNPGPMTGQQEHAFLAIRGGDQGTGQRVSQCIEYHRVPLENLVPGILQLLQTS
jgi:hypothetical protein